MHIEYIHNYADKHLLKIKTLLLQDFRYCCKEMLQYILFMQFVDIFCFYIRVREKQKQVQKEAFRKN